MASVVYLIRSVWTSSCLLSTSTSNLPCFLFPFGLPRDFPLLQRPIHRVFSSILDFLVLSLRFNVQSATLACPFWTSAYLPSSSTSNLPLNIIHFGLQRTVSPLQRPICRVSTSPTKGSRILRSAPVGAKPRSTGPRAPLSKNPATPCFIH